MFAGNRALARSCQAVVPWPHSSRKSSATTQTDTLPPNPATSSEGCVRTSHARLISWFRAWSRRFGRRHLLQNCLVFLQLSRLPITDRRSRDNRRGGDAPLQPAGGVVGFIALPLRAWVLIVGIVAAYVLAAELAKLWFYHSETRRRLRGGKPQL